MFAGIFVSRSNVQQMTSVQVVIVILQIIQVLVLAYVLQISSTHRLDARSIPLETYVTE
jgi:hypothetical protein